MENRNTIRPISPAPMLASSAPRMSMMTPYHPMDTLPDVQLRGRCPLEPTGLFLIDNYLTKYLVPSGPITTE